MQYMTMDRDIPGQLHFLHIPKCNPEILQFLAGKTTTSKKNTWMRHFTRSNGTTAVWVVPQLIMPPRPHSAKYLPDPNSQLYSCKSAEMIHTIRTDTSSQCTINKQWAQKSKFQKMCNNILNYTDSYR